MNYELAKELKEAGFPQNPKQHNESPMMGIDADETVRDCEPYDAYVPTLSELIEACGEDFWSLRYDEELDDNAVPTGGGSWRAIEHPRNAQKMLRTESRGSTPEEAVSRLWIALNKKDANN